MENSLEKTQRICPWRAKGGVAKGIKKTPFAFSRRGNQEEHLLQGIGAVLESSHRGLGKWICQATEMEMLFPKFAIRIVHIQPKTHSKKQKTWDKSPEGVQKEQIPHRSLQQGGDFFLERLFEPFSLFSVSISLDAAHQRIYFILLNSI